MKHLIAIIAVLAVAGFAIPESASAFDTCHGARRIVSYRPCGAPIYAVYNVSYYYGRPVGHWITQNTPCGCSACNPRAVIHNPIRQVHPGYIYGRAGYNACPPQRPSFGSRSGFSFRFGR